MKCNLSYIFSFLLWYAQSYSTTTNCKTFTEISSHFVRRMKQNEKLKPEEWGRVSAVSILESALNN